MFPLSYVSSLLPYLSLLPSLPPSLLPSITTPLLLSLIYFPPCLSISPLPGIFLSFPCFTFLPSLPSIFFSLSHSLSSNEFSQLISLYIFPSSLFLHLLSPPFLPSFLFLLHFFYSSILIYSFPSHSFPFFPFTPIFFSILGGT